MHKNIMLKISITASLFFLISTFVYAQEPIKVNFTVLGAVIGPVKINGKSWDVGRAVDPSASGLIAELMAPGSGALVSSVVNTVSQVAANGTAAPDVVGYIQQVGPTTRYLSKISGTPIELAGKRTLARDSYTPNFQAGYSGWPIFIGTRFRIHLWDLDFQNHDTIAAVEITYDDIMSAIKHGKTKWIKVADQSNNQLLYIQISASSSLEYTKPSINGYRFSW